VKYKGVAHVFGDDVNTDEILPARYMSTHSPSELAKHCMEDADKNFVKKIKFGDIIVAGKNFGCGSSREHAPISIKAVGISCVVAKSFARIFYRNAINIGLPIVASEGASEHIRKNDKLEVDTHKGIIKNITRKKVYKTEKYAPFVEKIIKKGGLMNYVKH